MTINPKSFHGQTFTCKAVEKGNKWRILKRFTQGWKPFACSKCDKSFTDNGDLKKHYMTQTRERPFACTKYDISLSHSINLKEHERTYTGEIHLSVQNVTSALQEIVILSFITWLTKERSNLLAQNLIYHFHSSDLKKHERTHTGDDPFACS